MPNVVAYLSYVLLNTFTPGPNNILAMSYGTRRGFRGSIPFSLGVFAGFFTTLSLGCAFSLTLYGVLPGIKPVMQVLGAAYMVWLAYKVVTATPHDDDVQSGSGTFVSGLALQFLNPKAILYGITVASTFLVPYFKSWPVLGGFCLFMALMGFVSTNSWALFGVAFQRFLGRYERFVSVAMGVLLVYCAVSLFL